MSVSCFNSEKKKFIGKCNIEEIQRKRKYLKIILKHYSINNANLIPKKCVCRGESECSELLKNQELKEAIKEAQRSEKGPTEEKKVENYIQYPIFMGLLRIQIKKDGKWINLLTEEGDKLKPEIKYTDKYFDKKNKENEHIRYPYISMVMLLIENLKNEKIPQNEIVDFLNAKNIFRFSARNRTQTRWDIDEFKKQIHNKKRVEQLKKVDSLTDLANDELIIKIQNMLKG